MNIRLWSVIAGAFTLVPSARAAELTLSIVRASDGASAVTATRSTVVEYEIRGILNGASDNDGLAFWSADLEFGQSASAVNHTGGAVPAGMARFARSDGFSNPNGYGGTLIEGRIVQIGGGQNVIGNDAANAPFPVGPVTLNVGHNLQVLATGSYQVPETAEIGSRHVLTLTHCLASVINDGGPPHRASSARTNCGAASLIITVIEPPATTVTGAITRKTNSSGPGAVCDLSLMPEVISDSRQSGVTQIRIAFDAVPGDPPSSAGGVTLEQKTCAAPTYVSYSGASAVTGAVVGNELVLTFAPALENARTYRLSIGPEVTTESGQQVQVRSLMGDVNGDGFVNSTDRSAVMAVWTAGSFSCATDVNSDGFTNGTDRSLVVAAWTGPQNCAP